MQTKASRGAGIIPPIENDRKGLGNSFFKGLPISNGVGGKARKASKDKKCMESTGHNLRNKHHGWGGMCHNLR